MKEQTSRLLTIDNLSLNIKDKKVLRNINLDVKKGEIVLFCGKSGSGKSTLASVLSGYYKNMAATIDYDKLSILDNDLETFETYNRYPYLVVSFQNARLSLCTQNLREELIFVLENLDTDRNLIEEAVISQAKKHGIMNLLEQDFDTLSGGQLQRVAFCAIDLIDSKLYVLDEPFANIDDNSTYDLQKIIRQRLDEGSSYLIIDHRLELWDFVDRVVVIDPDGRIVDDKINPKNISQEQKKLLIDNGLIFDGKSSQEKSLNASIDFLKAYNLNISYETDKEVKSIIKDSSFSMPANKLIALTGESGAGKSTLFKVLLRQLSYNGSIKIWDKELNSYRKKDLLGRTGLVFQDPTLQFVRTNVLEEFTGHRNYDDVSQENIDLLKTYRLDTYVDKSPWMLSQGEQRRLAVLTMLALDKDLLLVDEPTYGQDFKNASLIMDDLKALSKDTTIIFTSHDQNLIRAYKDVEYRIIDKKVVRIDW